VNTAPNTRSGSSRGNRLAEKSNDFLDPEDIIEEVDSFSNSISPPNSPTELEKRLLYPSPFPKNPKPTDYLNRTVQRLKDIMDPNFGKDITVNVPKSPTGLPIPDYTHNPDALTTFLYSMAFANSIRPVGTSPATVGSIGTATGANAAGATGAGTGGASSAQPVVAVPITYSTPNYLPIGGSQSSGAIGGSGASGNTNQKAGLFLVLLMFAFMLRLRQ